MKRNKNEKRPLKGQLSFDFDIPKEQDRNFHLGGRSFYFFDFDDNIAYLSTPIILFHKITGAEVAVSSGEFAHESRHVGKSGKFENYFLDINDEKGSFRHFRDKEFSMLETQAGKKQSFVEDIEKALAHADHIWKAPSWNCFYHATYNHRPVSVITARGHGRDTIKDGIDMMVQDGHLPHSPNYHSIYPVSNIDIRKELGDIELKKNVAELKREAIRASVEKAIEVYGHSPFHRFGMSDDDHKNIELISEEMRELKKEYPEMSFFVIETFKDSFAKYEILINETRQIISQKESKSNQLTLF
jgi:hypothetical protein